MTKKSGSRIGRLFKRVVNVRSWSDFDRIKRGQQYIFDTCSRLFIPQTSNSAVESFDDVKARLNLSDDDLKTRESGLLRLTRIMLGFAFFMFLYAIYNLVYAHYAALIISITVMFMALVLSFRYHFWYFQIKQHKLGCTLKEWFMNGVMGAKHE